MAWLLAGLLWGGFTSIPLGFKLVKWTAGIEFVAHYAEVGGGHRGYNEDHEFFGYRQSI